VFILQNNLILYRRYFYLIDQTENKIKCCMVCRYKMAANNGEGINRHVGIKSNSKEIIPYNHNYNCDCKWDNLIIGYWKLECSSEVSESASLCAEYAARTYCDSSNSLLQWRGNKRFWEASMLFRWEKNGWMERNSVQPKNGLTSVRWSTFNACRVTFRFVMTAAPACWDADDITQKMEEQT